MLLYFNHTEAKRKGETGSTSAAETSDPVAGEQADRYLNHPICLYSVLITLPSRFCHTNEY